MRSYDHIKRVEENRMINRVFKSKIIGMKRMGRQWKRWIDKDKNKKILGYELLQWSKQKRLYGMSAWSGSVKEISPDFDYMPRHGTHLCYDVH